MTYYSEPLNVSPFLRIERKTNRAQPGQLIKITPKLAATPMKIKWSPNQRQMALVSDLRRENLSGIGSPTEDPPEGGVRIFSQTDRFLLLGGEAAKAAVMYERTGPVFQRTDVITLPSMPDFITLAVFSYDTGWLFTVQNSAPNTIKTYRFSGADALDPDGVFSPGADIAFGAAVTALRISPEGRFLIAESATGFKLYNPDPTITEYTTSKPAGWCRGILADESRWLIEPATSSDLVQVYRFESDTFTLDQTLFGSAGTDRFAEFSPDGQNICLIHKPTTGSTPIFYALVDDVWTLASITTHASPSALASRMPVFFPDSEKMLLALKGSVNGVELYEKGTVTPVPLEAVSNDMPFEMTAPSTSFSSASLDGKLYFIDDPSTDLRIIRLSDVSAPIEITRPAAMNGGHYSSMSADGSIITVDNKVFKFDGVSTFTQLTVTSPPASIDRIEVSHSGKYFAVFFRKAAPTYGSLRFFERDLLTDAITSIGTDFDFNINYNQTRNALFSPTEDLLISNIAAVGVFRTWRLSGGVFVAGADLPGGPFTSVQQSATFSPDGSLIAILTGSAPVAMKVLKRQTDGSFLVLYTSPTLSATGNGIFIRFAPDGRAIAVSLSATPFFALFKVDAGAITPAALPVVMPASVASLVWGPEALYVLQTGTDLKYEYSHMVEYPTFNLIQTFAVTVPGADPPEIWGLAPTGNLMHFGIDGEGQHRLTSSPYTEATTLFFEPNWPADQVWDVLYGHTGKVVVASTPDGPTMAQRAAGGDFINSRDVSGIYVTIFDLSDDQTMFVERDYARHVLGTDVKDIVFSKTSKVFAYHAQLPEDAPVGAAEGRLIYDITEKRYEFRGAVWDTYMDGTFIAFSPWETHFVVTRHRTIGDPSISLHKFLDDYYFEDKDEELVAYGPPAFSMCDDVVVAHGGTPPFTFFKHDRDIEQLIPQTTGVDDWTSEGVILDVEFTEDCEGMVVLTPTEIINIPQDPDTGDWTAQPPTELDTPAGEGDSLGGDPDTPDQWSVNPTSPGGLDYPGGYQLNPNDDVFFGINYVPYTVITVTKRVRPVPL